MGRFKAFFAVVLLIAFTLASCKSHVSEGPPGEQGEPGIAEPQGQNSAGSSRMTLGEDGYWYIDGVSTGIKAMSEVVIGDDGYWYINGEKTGFRATPEILIGTDGYWYINGEKSSFKATLENYSKPPDIEIGEDNYWYINGERTAVKAAPEDIGEPPEIHIGPDGFWYINGDNSGIGAKPDIYIGEDGNWYINGKKTGVKAYPEIYIGEDGYWYINGENTDVIASTDVIIGEGGFLYINGENTGIMTSSPFMEFFEDGVFTVPTKVTKITISACGGGGGGGRLCGGGGAAFVAYQEIAVFPGQVFSLTVGRGGRGSPPDGSQGTDGGTTKITYPSKDQANNDITVPLYTLPGGQGAAYRGGYYAAGGIGVGIGACNGGDNGKASYSKGVLFSESGENWNSDYTGGGGSLGGGGGGTGGNGNRPGGYSPFAYGGHGRGEYPQTNGQGKTGGLAGTGNSGGGGGAMGGGGGGGNGGGGGGHGYVLITWEYTE